MTIETDLHRLATSPALPLIATAIAVALALSACGGGGSSSSTTPVACSTCAAGTLSGTAAAGAALAGAEIRVTGANGQTAAGVASADGVYRVDVSALTAPYIVQALANVGGEPLMLHSLATAADVGSAAINVTPLTEIITASVLGGDPRAQLDAASVDFGAITGAALASAEQALETRLAPVLAAAGLTNIDLRSTEFRADHSGLDGVLDALKVTQDSGGYTIALVTGSASITVDPTKLSEPASTLPAPATGDLAALAARTQEMQTLLAGFAAKFASAVPAAADLVPSFTDDFLHDGQPRDAFIGQVLRQQDAAGDGGFSWQGVSFDALRIDAVIDADTLDISFRTVFRRGFQPGSEQLRVKRVAGVWRFAGNGRQAHVSVTLLSRLKETPLTEAQVQALPGINSFQLGGQTHYQMATTDAAGQPLQLWIGSPQDGSFGQMAWAGDNIGAPARAQRRQYTRYLATPDSRVSNYLILNVPTLRVAANVAAIVVTGPGLPAGGLALEPPVRRPRPNWVFKGDVFDWNAFNNERCAQIDNPANPVPNCAIDWSQIHRGSEFRFTLKDAAGNTVDTLTDKLRSEPVDEARAFANRASLFARFAVDDAHALSIANLFDDAAGPYRPGLPVTLNWTVPGTPGFRVTGISLTTQTSTLDANNQPVSTDYPGWVPLYDVDPRTPLPTSASFAPAHPVPPSWAWTTLSGIDAFGNTYDHELSPSNPK